MHKPGQIHRLGEFGTTLQPPGYKGVTGSSVAIEVAFGEIDDQIIAAAERA